MNTTLIVLIQYYTKTTIQQKYYYYDNDKFFNRKTISESNFPGKQKHQQWPTHSSGSNHNMLYNTSLGFGCGDEGRRDWLYGL